MCQVGLLDLLCYKFSGADLWRFSCMVKSFSVSKVNAVLLICGSLPLVMENPGWGNWFSGQWLRLVTEYTENIIWDYIEHYIFLTCVNKRNNNIIIIIYKKYNSKYIQPNLT